MKRWPLFIFFSLTVFLLLSANYSRADLSSCNFTRSLTVGLKGIDVTCLQLYLQSEGFFKYSGGPTGYFGSITRDAVAKWQTNKGVFPTWGYFGPISRAKYKELVTAAIQAQNQNQAKDDTLTLSLPTVSDDEITIDSSGAKTIDNYIDYFLKNSSELSFDGKKFESALKDGNGIFLFVPQLVEKAVKDGLNQEIKNSLLVHKEFTEVKLVFLKSIKVSGEAVELNKKMIGFDKLTIGLIQKTLDMESGKVSKDEISDLLRRYETTAELERSALLKKLGLITENPSLLKRIIVLFGLEDQFFALAAAGLPFGGTIGVPIYCTCSVGFLIPVGLPTPPVSGSLFVPVVFLGSPLFYEYKSLRPGAWWLGLYSPVLVPCLQICPVGCCPVGLSNLIYMTGTSF